MQNAISRKVGDCGLDCRIGMAEQAVPAPRPATKLRIFALVGQAKQAVLFLLFGVGNNVILDAAGHALHKQPELFVRGALTSTVRAANFAQDDVSMTTTRRSGPPRCRISA